MALMNRNRYQFAGSPVSQAASIAANKADRGAEAAITGALYNAQGNLGAAQYGAYGQIGAANQNAQGQIGAANQNAQGQVGAAQQNAMGAMYNAYGNGMGNVASAYAGLYGGYNNALQNLYSAQYASSGMAEAARQAGLANLGSAAMSAGGQASGAALGAWGANQSAFAKAMADSQAANQTAISNYGVGREAALAALGGSAANLGSALGNSYTNYQQGANNYSRDMSKLDVARELGLGQLELGNRVASSSPYGGGVSLTADGQPLSYASGTAGGGYGYSPLPSSGGGSYAGQPGPGDAAALAGLQQTSDRGYGAIDASRADISGSPILGALTSGADAGRSQLDNAYYSSRNQPSQLLGQSLGSFAQMLQSGSRDMNAGMNQFYQGFNNSAADRMREGMQMGSSALGGIANSFGSMLTTPRPSAGAGITAPKYPTMPSFGDMFSQQRTPTSDRQLYVAFQQGLISKEAYDAGRRRNLGL